MISDFRELLVLVVFYLYAQVQLWRHYFNVMSHQAAKLKETMSQSNITVGSNSDLLEYCKKHYNGIHNVSQAMQFIKSKAVILIGSPLKWISIGSPEGLKKKWTNRLQGVDEVNALH